MKSFRKTSAYIHHLTVVFILITYAVSVSAEEGPVEIRVGREVLQSLVAAYLPVTLKHEVSLMGIFKVPLTIRLANPGPLRFMPPAEGGHPSVFLEVDYDTAADSVLLFTPTRGRARGGLIASVNPEGTALVLDFTELNIDVSPQLRLSLGPLLKPVHIPLFGPHPLQLPERRLYLCLRNVSLHIDRDEMVIKATASFDKTPGLTL